MGFPISTWVSRVRQHLGNPGESKLSTADIEEHVRAAVRRFSSDRGRELHSDYVGDGVAYDFAVPAAWVAGFSQPKTLEYPQGERVPVFLDMAEVTIYPDTSAPVSIRLLQTIPGTGKVLRVIFNAPWPIPDVTTTTDVIPATSYEAVASLAASLSAEELAGKAASNKPPSMPGALVNVETEQDRWLAISRARLKAYKDHLGTETVAPADGIFDWDARSQQRDLGLGYLFHHRR